VELLSRLFSLQRQDEIGSLEFKFDLIPHLLSGLPKDNQLLTECVMTQTDLFGVLENFETKFVGFSSFQLRERGRRPVQGFHLFDNFLLFSSNLKILFRFFRTF
jgi:hypothetical protein